MEKKIDKRIGNKFWMNRTNICKARMFDDAGLLQDAAETYFRWCDNNPRERNEAVKSKLEWGEANISIGRPYTMRGLCVYLGVSGRYFNTASIELRAKIDEGKATPAEIAVLDTIEWIEDVVFTEVVEGALVGQYKENLVSRLHGISDNINNVNKGDPILKIVTRDDATTRNLEALKDLI